MSRVGRRAIALPAAAPSRGRFPHRKTRQIMTEFLRYRPLGLSLALLSAIAATLAVSPAASARPLPPSVLELAEVEDTPRNGVARVTRNEDESYTAEIRIDASAEEVWAVIVDYNRFSEFLPNVISSALLEVEGDRHVIEQVNEQRVLFLNVRSRIRTENLETQNQRIDFRLLEGDLNQLEGSWVLEPTDDGGVLLTQTVRVAPPDGTPNGIFHDIFERSLADTLEAVRDEVRRRQSDRDA